MGFFDFFSRPDIHQGVDAYQSTAGAVLLDVRTPEEYAAGHIPESRNIPLQSLGQVAAAVERKDTPLFVYCHSGARSAQAVALLRRMGYSNVSNIGGIAAYRGEMEG